MCLSQSAYFCNNWICKYWIFPMVGYIFSMYENIYMYSKDYSYYKWSVSFSLKGNFIVHTSEASSLIFLSLVTITLRRWQHFKICKVKKEAVQEISWMFCIVVGQNNRCLKTCQSSSLPHLTSKQNQNRVIFNFFHEFFFLRIEWYFLKCLLNGFAHSFPIPETTVYIPYTSFLSKSLTSRLTWQIAKVNRQIWQIRNKQSWKVSLQISPINIQESKAM